ncbi:hypothetical protein CMPG5300_3230 (plasmid) [Lactiplantibacillus plantarum CMPG5300]|uniref:Uncharacterized protein n=1 Tax=Lactiplantibacillus plantarum CMPG5300 TaxID=1304889 RepID=A0AAW3FJC5_LACPN|nr:hypothetical protein CMPG5300_3230 [Lactiplantibacillus plantarum CMPG5300]
MLSSVACVHLGHTQSYNNQSMLSLNLLKKATHTTQKIFTTYLSNRFQKFSLVSWNTDNTEHSISDRLNISFHNFPRIISKNSYLILVKT